MKKQEYRDYYMGYKIEVSELNTEDENIALIVEWLKLCYSYDFRMKLLISMVKTEHALAVANYKDELNDE